MIQGIEFTYGTIQILREELISLEIDSSINLYLADRVTFIPRVIPQSASWDTIKLNLRLSQEKYTQWLNYFKNAPTGIMQSLDTGYVVLPSCVVESMSANLEKMVWNGSSFIKVWKCDITMIKSN